MKLGGNFEEIFKDKIIPAFEKKGKSDGLWARLDPKVVTNLNNLNAHWVREVYKK